MEAAEEAALRDRGRAERSPGPAEAAEAAGAAGAVARGPPLSGTSYWLDFWLMIAFDLALFVFVYLLP